MDNQIKCEICGALRDRITTQHLKTHGISSIEEYKCIYKDAKIYSESALSNARQGHNIKIDQPLETIQLINNLHIPKHRTKKRITYQEFLSLLDQGLGLKSIKSIGVSKHQVDFYSALAQNKITITKEQFETEYKSGASLEEIAERYNIQRDHVTQLRDFYGIKRLGAKFINRKKTEKPLTFRQEKIIYGGLMGDAGRMSPASIKMKQSTKQRDYLMWKYDELKEHVSTHSLQEFKTFDERYNKHYEAIRFYTNANTGVETIINKFYIKTHDGKNMKIITQDILDHLDELSLAVWFMDDGKTDWGLRVLTKHPAWNVKPTAIFCTDSFPYDNLIVIKDWFHAKWNIDLYLQQQNRGKGIERHLIDQYRLKFDAQNTHKLFSMISPFVHTSMKYKVDLPSYITRIKQDDIMSKQYATIVDNLEIGEFSYSVKKKTSRTTRLLF